MVTRRKHRGSRKCVGGSPSKKWHIMSKGSKKGHWLRTSKLSQIRDLTPAIFAEVMSPVGKMPSPKQATIRRRSATAKPLSFTRRKGKYVRKNGYYKTSSNKWLRSPDIDKRLGL